MTDIMLELSLAHDINCILYSYCSIVISVPFELRRFLVLAVAMQPHYEAKLVFHNIIA